MQNNDAAVNFTIRSCAIQPLQTTRSTSNFFTSAMALAGLSPFGHTCAQFRIVWQR